MLKRRLRMKYREFVDFLSITLVPYILELTKIPHYTTLQKYFKRTSSSLFDIILARSVKLFSIENPWIAIDATGFSSSYASKHYEKRTGNERKDYNKNSIAIDVKTQVIVAHKTRKSPRHDSIDADALIRKCKNLKAERFQPR